MKKQMKRTVYEAPLTERFQVELEGAMMSASADIQNPGDENGKIEEHEINSDFTGGDFSGESWD